MMQQFSFAKKSIKENLLNVNIEYANNITSSLIYEIQKYVHKGSLVEILKQNYALRERLEEDLRHVLTQRYRFVYVVAKKDGKFRFLLDGSRQDKSAFLEPFQPLKPKE
jgi:hypothetical protein